MSGKRVTDRLGETIRELRARKGVSQEEFAGMCGLHRTYVGSIERGEKSVTIETACKLARALGVSLSELIRQAEERPEDDGD